MEKQIFIYVEIWLIKNFQNMGSVFKNKRKNP